MARNLCEEELLLHAIDLADCTAEEIAIIESGKEALQQERLRLHRYLARQVNLLWIVTVVGGAGAFLLHPLIIIPLFVWMLYSGISTHGRNVAVHARLGEDATVGTKAYTPTPEFLALEKPGPTHLN